MTGFGVTLSLVLVSAAFGQEPGPAASLPDIGHGNVPAKIVATNQVAPMPPASPDSMPVLTDPSKDRWWISETVDQSRKDQQVFFGVRLANAPQAALAEIYSKSYTAGETLAVRLWGCNDLPMEFMGRVQVALKRGNEQFARWEETVRLAPETVKRLAKYSFDTEDLAAGQYALETSLFDDAGELVQQQVTMLMVQVTRNQEARRQAKAAKKAKKEAELKAKADLSRRSALAKAEAERQAAEADLSRRSALAKAEAAKTAELKAKAEAKAAKKAELKAKAEAEKKAAADLKAQAKAVEKAKKEAELKAQAEAEQKAADEAKIKKAEKDARDQAAATEKAKKEAELKAQADLSRRSALAKAEAEKKAAADLKARAKAVEKAKKEAELKAQADLSRRNALAKAEAEKQAAEAEAAKKAAEQKLFEDTKSKYMTQEKSAIAVKTAALARQETEYQAKIVQAEADQQAAETKATALALKAQTMQANFDTAITLEKRLKQIAKQDGPKDVKVKRAVDAKVVEKARKQADLSRRSALAKADAAKRIAEDKAEVTSDAKAALVKQRKSIAEQKADLEAQAVKKAERKAKDEIKANQVASKAKHDAELKAQADLSRRSALAKEEAVKKAAADMKARAKAAEKAKKDAELQAKADLKQKAADEAKAKKEAELKAQAEAEKQAAEAEAAKKVADQKLFEKTREKYLAQEKDAIIVQAAALAMVKQEIECQFKVLQAEADQQVAEMKAEALVLEAKTAQAYADTQAAGEARKQADLSRRSALAKADAARLIADDKAKMTSEAKAALVKQRKSMAEQKADLEAQAVKNAEQKARTEIKLNEALLAREAKVKKAEEAMAIREAKLKQTEESLAVRETKVKQIVESLVVREAKVKKLEEALEARGVRVKDRISARAVVTGPQPPAQPTAMSQAVARKLAAVKSKKLDPDQWRVAVAMLSRRIGVQNFRTMGSYSAGYPIGAKSSNARWAGPAGGLNDAGNHVYNDGYVGTDNYTDLDSGTWNWGYDSGDQVNGNQIEFAGVDQVWREASRQTTATDVESSDDAASRGALMVEMGRYLAKIGFVDYGLSLGLSRAQTFQASAGGINTFNDRQSSATYENRVLDAYDITGLGITPDSVPYRGNATDKGPVIDATPMSRRDMGSALVSSDSYRAYNSISESLDMDLSTLSLGMSIKGNYRRVYVVGSTGPTLNMVEKDATYEETLFESDNGGSPQVLKYWGDNSSGNEYLFGYYVQAEVGVRIYRELHLGVFGRYDWLENVSGNVGPSRYEINASGGSLGGTVGLNF